jgi:hypothetical protein
MALCVRSVKPKAKSGKPKVKHPCDLLSAFGFELLA